MNTWGILIIIAFFVILTMISANKNKKQNEAIINFQNELKIGDKVKTYSGLYGEIILMRKALDGTNVVTLKTGDDEHASYLTMSAYSIAGIDEKDNNALYNTSGTDMSNEEQVKEGHIFDAPNTEESENKIEDIENSLSGKK